MAKIRRTQYMDKDFYKFYWGTFKEHFNALVTSNGTVITLTLTDSDGNGFLTTQFSDGFRKLTTPATVPLNLGTDTAPQGNYVYILQSAPDTLVAHATQWPTAEHIKIGFFFVQSATQVQSDGALINQNWNDGWKDGNNTGHVTHVGQWIRSQGATWFSGVAGEGSDNFIDLQAGDTEAYIKVGSGVISQMHQHNYVAHDTANAGDDVHVVNYHNGTIPVPYTEVSDIATVTYDSAGGSLSGKYYNILIGGVANKGGEYSPIMMKMPSGSYGNSSDAIDDVDGYTDYSMPREFGKESSTGFYIAKVTLKHAVGTNIITVVNTVDLRGIKNITAAYGSGAGGAITEFSDTQFKVFDNLDATRIIQLTADNITTGNTRAITMADADVDLADVVSLPTTYLKQDGSTSLTGDWNNGAYEIGTTNGRMYNSNSNGVKDSGIAAYGTGVNDAVIDIYAEDGDAWLWVENDYAIWRLQLPATGTDLSIYNQDLAANAMTVANATNNISMAADLAVTGNITGNNLSGTNTGDDPADDTAYNATSWDANTDAATKNAIRDKVETMDTAIGLNTSKLTNVPTELSVGTVGVNTVAITSDGGVDDVTLPAATVAAAGMLTTAKWGEIVANNAKNTNVTTNLSLGAVDATTMVVASSDGTDATLIEADTDDAGLLGADKWDEIVASTTHLGLTNNPHTVTAAQAGAVPVTLADAANDFIVASADDTFVKKTLAETGAILEGDIDHGNLQGLSTGADHSYIDQDVTSGSTPTFGDIKGETKSYDVTVLNPNAAYDLDTQIPVGLVKSNMIVTKIQVSLNTTAQEVTGDLKWADNLTAFTGATLINDFDTTSGVRTDTSITAGSVAAGKWLYLQFDAQPHADITWMTIHIEWDYS